MRLNQVLTQVFEIELYKREHTATRRHTTKQTSSFELDMSKTMLPAHLECVQVSRWVTQQSVVDGTSDLHRVDVSSCDNFIP